MIANRSKVRRAPSISYSAAYLRCPRSSGSIFPDSSASFPLRQPPPRPPGVPIQTPGLRAVERPCCSVAPLRPIPPLPLRYALLMLRSALRFVAGAPVAPSPILLGGRRALVGRVASRGRGEAGGKRRGQDPNSRTRAEKLAEAAARWRHPSVVARLTVRERAAARQVLFSFTRHLARSLAPEPQWPSCDCP